MKNLEKELKEVISSAIACDKDTLNDNSGLGKHILWDSLGQIAIIIALEKKYNIKIKVENIQKLLTFSSIKDFINKNAK
jgi:acyl carrier protein